MAKDEKVSADQVVRDIRREARRYLRGSTQAVKKTYCERLSRGLWLTQAARYCEWNCCPRFHTCTDCLIASEMQTAGMMGMEKQKPA